MYDWYKVQSIVTESLPRDALRRLREMEAEIEQDVERQTAFLSRVRDRIDGLTKVIGDEPTLKTNDVQALVDRINHEPDTLRNQVIKVLLAADYPMTPKGVSECIPGAQYHEVWRVFSKPKKGMKALVQEPFINTIGFGRDRRYEIPKST
jgi:hypothetical protein